jgi:spore coat protein U-like protein
MSQDAPPIHSNGTIAVTCTRHPQDKLAVDVTFELKGVVVQEFPRQMRDIGATGTTLAYDMYIDPARTRLWGDGNQGTAFFEGTCFLDERNRVCTLPFLLYGTVFGGQSAIPPGQFTGAIVSRLEYRFLGCSTTR